MFFKKIIKWFLSFFNIHIILKLNKKKITIPIRGAIGTNLLSIKKHETFMNPLIKEIYTDKGIFLDVGMNLGQTLLKFKTLFPDSQYLGVEPNPNCVSYVNYLIESNKFKNCKILSAGLANNNSVKQLLFRNKTRISNDSEASIIADYRPTTKEEIDMYMSFIKLDLFDDLKNIKVELIKMDVEGAEILALEGMKEKLQNDRSNIIIEILPALRGNTQLRKKFNNEINKFLVRLNYNIFEIKEGHYSFDLEKLLSIPKDKKDLTNYNYLLIPNENTKKFLNKKT